MLIVALALAVIGLAALVFAVVTSNELVAWVCIAASVLGVVLLITDALQERQRREAGAIRREAGETTRQPVEAKPRRGQDTAGYASPGAAESGTHETFDADYPDDADTSVDETSTREPGTAADE
jgi:hypothetical protein